MKNKEEKNILTRGKLTWIILIGSGLGIISYFFDGRIMLFIANARITPLNQMMGVLSIPIEIALRITFFSIIILIFLMKDKRFWITPLIIVIIASSLISTGVSQGFERDRPFEYIDPISESGQYTELAENYPIIGGLLERLQYSFPSGHTSIYFSAIPILAFVLGKWWAWTLFAVLVGFSRLYVGAHFLSDVIFGAILGLVIGWILLRIYLNSDISHRLNHQDLNL